MDKKKVIELIEDTILMVDTIEGFDDGDTEQLLNVRRKLNGALDELSKSDWISVEDELPPIGDVVRVRSKQNPNDLMIACRTDESTMKTVYPLNKFYSQDITHWHKIDKLEV